MHVFIRLSIMSFYQPFHFFMINDIDSERDEVYVCLYRKLSIYTFELFIYGHEMYTRCVLS